MRRRGCCGLFLLKLVVYLHSLRFSGEVKLLKNSKFENLLSEGSLSVVVSCVDTRVALPFEFTPLYISLVSSIFVRPSFLSGSA